MRVCGAQASTRGFAWCVAAYSKNTRDPDRRRRRCFHANFTTPGLTKWCRRKRGVSCARCCSYFAAILRCGYNRRDPAAADPGQHGARDGKQKLQQSKSNIPPHVQNPATIKCHMPIRRETCTEEAFPLRRGPKGQAAEPRTGPPTPAEKTRFKLLPAAVGHAAAEPSRFRDYIPWEVGR